MTRLNRLDDELVSAVGRDVQLATRLLTILPAALVAFGNESFFDKTGEDHRYSALRFASKIGNFFVSQAT